MKSSETALLGSPPLAASDAGGGLSSVIFVLAAAGAALFAIVASGSGEPLLLTLLAVLAMLGLFFLLAVAAGHVRLGARVNAADILKAAADAAPDASLVTGQNGAALYWNDAFDAIVGRADAGPLAALEAACRADPGAAQALFRLTRAAERGAAHSEDIQLPSGGGQFPDLGVDGRRLRVDVKPFLAMVGAEPTRLMSWRVFDVSTIAAVEKARIDELEVALAAIDLVPFAFASVSASGALLRVNPAFERATGYAAGVLAKSLTSSAATIAAIAGDDGARQLAAIATDRSRESCAIELEITRGDGGMAPLALHVTPIGGGAYTLTALDRDASRPSGPRAGEARVGPFFQSAPFGIATVDADGRITTCNAAFNRMAFDSRPRRNVRAIDALCANADADERNALADALDAALAGRAGVAPIEITAGEQRQFTRRIYLAPIASGGGSAALYVLDATEQKALEGRYAQAQKMEAVGKLAGGIAHDFNNVLTAIIGFSDLLLQTKRPTDPDYRDIRNIQSAANRAAGLVANLLGFSRKQTQQVSVLNLAEVAADLTPILRTSVGEKIELKIQSERDLWYVRADRAQIDNVLINLSVNARDAMAGGGRLTIRTRNVSERQSAKLISAPGFKPGEYVLIEVADTGSGMSADTMTKIFEPFFTTKGVGKGTGLGLASVYGIVKQSGGFIMPESEVGVGTTFRVLLPRHTIDEDAEAAAQASRPVVKRDVRASDLTGTGRVLLVEDEVEVRQFAVRALKRQGYEVLEAGDGVEALEIMAANGDVDIVVSDVVMPEMDGPTLFRELRKRNPSIKVIFVSGYPNEAFREQLGGDDFAFLPKPFSLPQLAAKVKEELAK